MRAPTTSPRSAAVLLALAAGAVALLPPFAGGGPSAATLPTSAATLPTSAVTLTASAATLPASAAPLTASATALTATVAPPGAAGAPAQDAAALGALLDRHRHEITGTAEDPAGPGLEFLLEAGRQADLFLIGESHMTEEIPLLTARLARELRSAGYGIFAVETGPLTTRRMLAALGRGGMEAHRAEVARYPYTVPFFEGIREAAMLAATLEAGYTVLGLDQEFVGSGRYWLDRLEALAPDDDARALVAGWQEREAAAVAHYMETGSTEETIFLTITEEELDALDAAFAGSAEAREILAALRESATIYQLYTGGRNYENNHRRVAYMKGNLIDGLEAAGGPLRSPKVLMKFGSVHMPRGRGPVNQHDLGNLAQELAVLRGGTSFHLQAAGLGRQALDGSHSDWTTSLPEWQPLFDRVGDGPWTVFDLRPLRPFFHRSDNAEAWPSLTTLVFGYDAVAISPELHEAEQLAPLSR